MIFLNFFKGLFLIFTTFSSPLPCSYPACSEFCVHLEFLFDIVCKVGKVCKVEKLHSTFHTFHDYLNFCGEKKDDRLFTIYKYPRENVPEEELKKTDALVGGITG